MIHWVRGDFLFLSLSGRKGCESFVFGRRKRKGSGGGGVVFPIRRRIELYPGNLDITDDDSGVWFHMA